MIWRPPCVIFEYRDVISTNHTYIHQNIPSVKLIASTFFSIFTFA